MKLLFICATVTLIMGLLMGGVEKLNANERSYFFEGVSIYVCMILILGVKTVCGFGKEASF